MISLANHQNNPESVTAYGRYVYWVDQNSGTVNKVPVDGGTVTTLARGQNTPLALAVAAAHVYWIDAGPAGTPNGTVNEVPVGGGPVTTLATGQDPVSVAVAP